MALLYISLYLIYLNYFEKKKSGYSLLKFVKYIRVILVRL